MTYRKECSSCKGSGRNERLWPRGSEDCKICKGKGYVEQDNVEPLSVITKLPLDADTVLRAALGRLDEVVIVGYTKEGEYEYFASSIPDGASVLWLLQRCGHKLLNDVDKETE